MVYMKNKNNDSFVAYVKNPQNLKRIYDTDAKIPSDIYFLSSK